MKGVYLEFIPTNPIMWAKSYAIAFAYCLVVFMVFTHIIKMIPLIGSPISCGIKKILEWFLDFIKVTDC